MAKKLTKAVARKVLATVDAGLTSGMGQPIPGQMCVEAAVCYALGLPHGDRPLDCVAYSLNQLKIGLNDAHEWVSSESRAKGMRKLAILQLGTAGVLNEVEFAQRLVPLAQDLTDRAARADAYAARATSYAAYAARAYAARAYAARAYAARAAAAAYDAAAYAAAADAAAAAADAARAAARAAICAAAARAAGEKEKELVYFADKVADILIDMKVPAVKWLDIL